MVYPYLIVSDTLVPSSFVTGLKARVNLAEIQHAVHNGYPSPTDTVDYSDLSIDGILPSFLNMRASDMGMTGYGSSNRIRQFIGVPFECRKRIASSYAAHGLLDPVIVSHMLRLLVKDLDRMERLWRVIEDGLFLSSPEIFIKGFQGPVRRIFHWYICHYIYHGHTETVSSYKNFLQFVKQKATKSEGGKLVEPTGFPWYDQVSMNLIETGIGWLDVVLLRGLKTKSEARRFMHFVSLRGAPCPNRAKQLSSLMEHQILRCTPPKAVDTNRLKELYDVGVLIGQRVDKKALLRGALRTEHISVSNSSCFERSRSKGGRASYVQEKVTSWLKRVPSSPCNQLLLLGDLISVKADIPYWKSFAPVEPLSERELDPLTEYGSPIEGAFLPKYAGLNNNSGYALLQWSFEEGVHRKVLDQNLKVIGIPNQRAISLGEPGDKARSLTIDEAWVTLYLTPFGHLLVDTLRTIPEVAAGLGFGQPCYHFVERLAKHVARNTDQRSFFEFSWFLTMDLDKATDHFDRLKTRYMLRGFLHGLGRDYENPYCLSALELLTAGRNCMWTI